MTEAQRGALRLAQAELVAFDDAVSEGSATPELDARGAEIAAEVLHASCEEDLDRLLAAAITLAESRAAVRAAQIARAPRRIESELTEQANRAHGALLGLEPDQGLVDAARSYLRLRVAAASVDDA